jgi:hypothetical protein
MLKFKAGSVNSSKVYELSIFFDSFKVNLTKDFFATIKERGISHLLYRPLADQV